MQLSFDYLSTASITNPRIQLVYRMPLSSIITTFHSDLKSLSSGFASLEYTERGYEAADLVKMNILVNKQPIDALCSVVHRSVAEKEGRQLLERLKPVVPRQLFEVRCLGPVPLYNLTEE